MAANPRLADVSVSESMQAEDAAMALVRILDAAHADGHVNAQERADVAARARTLRREVREAVAAAERCNVGELIAGSFLTARPLNPHTMRRAAELRMMVEQGQQDA